MMCNEDYLDALRWTVHIDLCFEFLK